MAVASNGYIYLGSYTSGVWRSTDNGDSWSDVSKEMIDASVTSLTVSPNGDIFAGTYSGVYVTSDSGRSWTLRTNGLGSLEVFALTITSTGLLYVGTIDGVFKSSGMALEWRSESAGLPKGDAVFSLASDSTGNVWASTSSDGTYSDGLYLMQRGGSYWQRADFGPDAWVVTGMVVDPKRGLIAKTKLGLYVITDLMGVKMWRRVPDVGDQVNSIALSASGTIYVGVGKHGVYCSSDHGTTWTAFNDGLTNLSVGALVVSSSGYIFAECQNQGVFRCPIVPHVVITAASVAVQDVQGDRLVELGIAKKGDQFIMINEADDLYVIQYQGRKGYILKKDALKIN